MLCHGQHLVTRVESFSSQGDAPGPGDEISGAPPGLGSGKSGDHRKKTLCFMGFVHQELVNVPTEHHPTIVDISSPTDISFGNVKQIPKKGHQSQPLFTT